MIGIEVLKDDLVVITKIISKVEGALEDNKFSLGEGLGLAVEAPKLFKVIKTWKSAVEELKDLSETEIVELNAHFVKEFDLVNDDAEALVEKILTVVISVASAFVQTKEIV